MPRKTKDVSNNDELKDTKKRSKKSTTKREILEKKPTTKTAKKADINKNASKSTTSSSRKKAVSSKSKKTSNSDLTVSSTIEYYDLPYRYNQTVVKILAQTPSILFVYWDISDADRINFENTYGNDFFSKTKPVLIVHNETMNYSFEVEINDFANSWYLHLNDADCKYNIELGRRPKSISNNNINQNYIYVSSSNELTTPNDHILFEKSNSNIKFKNIATNEINYKKIENFSFVKNISDLYKTIYNDELLEDVKNPSSNFK